MIEFSTYKGWSIVEGTVFKDGCPNPRLKEFQIKQAEEQVTVKLRAYLPDMTEVWKLILTVDAVRRIQPDAKIRLILPYLPFARQDRVCNKGEANGISAFARVINGLGFASVELLDPHSDVAAGAIDRCKVTDLAEFMNHYTRMGWMDFGNTWLVAPDAGAVKRVKELVKSLGAAGMITATKERDLETRELTKTKLDEDTTGRNILIVDDLCDGGRTFIALAKAIRDHGEPETLRLWVTHGIFSYGTEVVTEHFDGVYTTNSYQPDAIGHTDGAGEYNQKMHWFQV